MTSDTHLIVGNSLDYHAVAVAWALRQSNYNVDIWDGFRDGAEGNITFDIQTRAGISIGNKRHSKLGSVWFRRPLWSAPTEKAHPSSVSFIQNEFRALRVSIINEFEEISDLVIGGSVGKPASSKVHQLRAAVECGLKIPKTIVSNDFEEVARFLESNGSNLVKHFTPHFWVGDKGRSISSVGPSRIRDLRDITQESVQICPAIYQEVIKKKYDIRCTVLGDRIYSAKIDSRKGHAFFDWRSEYQNSDFRVVDCKISDGIEKKIRRLMFNLNLNFGCIDLVFDENNECYFLEINPDGQFLFLEKFNPNIPLLNAFTNMMAKKSCRYDVDLNRKINVSSFEQSKMFDDLIVDAEKSFAGSGFITYA